MWKVLAGGLAVVLAADVAVVAARSDDPKDVVRSVAVPAPSASPSATPSPAPPPKPKPKPKPPARVVFSVTVDGAKPRVMSATATGTAARTERQPADPAHAISRSTGRIVSSEMLDYNEYFGCGVAGCSTTRSTEMGIVIRNLNGGGRKVLTKGGFDTEPSFAPDGSAIAYLSHVRRKNGMESDAVMVMEPNGEHLRTFLAPRDGWYAAPVWSPDGEHIAVVERPNNAKATPSVVLLPVRGGEPKTIGRGTFDQLRWAPNGRFLIARGIVTGPYEGSSTQVTTGWDLWVVAVSGVPARRLTNLAARTFGGSRYYCGSSTREVGVQDPVVSPDSKHVAYSTNAPHKARAGRGWDVQVIGVDGKGQRTVWRAPAPRCKGNQITATVGRPLRWS